MARVRTLAQLRDAARKRADIEGSQHITDAELNESINESIAALHALCVEACEDDFAITASITTTPNVATYTVTLYKVRSVQIVDQGYVRELDRFMLSDLPRLTNSVYGGTGAPMMYRMIGGKIHFAPTPQAAYSVTVYGVAASADLASDVAELDGRDGWEEWVVLDAAIKCGLKEEQDVRDLVAERNVVLGRILSQMRSLDQGRPPMVQVTRQPWDTDY